MFLLNLLVGKGGQVEILPVFKDTKQSNKGKDLFEYLKDGDLFKGNVGEVYSDVAPRGDNIIFLGLGEKDKLCLNNLRKAFHSVGKKLNGLKLKSAKLVLEENKKISYYDTTLAIVERHLQSEYGF